LRKFISLANCCRRKFECEYQEDKLNFKSHFSWVHIHLLSIHSSALTHKKCRYYNDDNDFPLLLYMSKQYLSLYECARKFYNKKWSLCVFEKLRRRLKDDKKL
jgi:hypothetical protein